MGKSPWRYIKGDPQKLIDELKRYTTEVTNAIVKYQYKISKIAKKRLIETSPRRTKGEKHYADSWRISRTYEDGTSKMILIIHNKSKPGLTHLLEKGHLDINGKRVNERVHIAPVQQWLNQEFEKGVEEILKKYGK